MTGPDVTTYAELLYPGFFYPEESAKAVESRDPAVIAREAEPGVFAFRFYDLVTATARIGAQDVTLRSDAINESGLYYIDAERLSVADVEALPGDHSILLANMRGNGRDPVLRCRTGNFRPLEPGDQVISSITGEVSP